MQKSAVVVFIAFFFAVPSVYAYIDPGAGSYLIQIAIGSLLGGAYLVKKFWKSITSFISTLFKKLLKKDAS